MTTASENEHVGEDDQGGPWPRIAAAVLGLWLFFSAFIWQHSAPEQVNAGLVGLLVFAISIWAMFTPYVRYANTLIAAWLFFSSLFMTHATAGTVWNNIVVAVALFLVSLIPGGLHMTVWHPRARA